MDNNRNNDEDDSSYNALSTQRDSKVVIQDMCLPSRSIDDLDPRFNDNITSLSFHGDILIDNLNNILLRCFRLQEIQLDNVKLNYTNGEDKNNNAPKIDLNYLRTLKISTDSQESQYLKSRAVSLHDNTLDLFAYFKMINYGSLENIIVICTLEQQLLLALPIPFVPEYNFQPSNSLCDILYNNRCTLKQLIVGLDNSEQILIEFVLPEAHEPSKQIPIPREDQSILQQMLSEPQTVSHVSADHTFRDMCEFTDRQPTQFIVFITSEDLPLPSRWSCMLDHQNCLKHLSVSIMDEEVMNSSLAAADKSSNTLAVLSLHIIDNIRVIECDLKKIKNCSKILTFALTVRQGNVDVKNISSLPEGIQKLRISGNLCEKDTRTLVQTLPKITDLTLRFHKSDYPDACPFNFIKWAPFETILDFLHLEFIAIEADGLRMDWEETLIWSQSVHACLGVIHNHLTEIDREEIIIKMIPIAPLMEDDEQTSDRSILKSICSCLG